MPHHNAFNDVHQKIIVPDTLAGKRLDQALSILLNDYSRAQLQKWLKQGEILVDSKVKKAKDRLIGGEEICLNIRFETKTKWLAQDIPLDIVYEDEAIIIINKPANFVVHPGAGNPENTLSNALLAHHPNFEKIPRAGIVHRLDKDTTGLIVAAKTLQAHHCLVAQLSQRKVTREYQAIATGCITMGKTIHANIGRNPHNRLKMAVTPNGKDAITHFTILERYRAHTRIRCHLETGRTHQIRVHMQHIRAPLLGDPLYNPRLKIAKGTTSKLGDSLRQFKRQALHAYKLRFTHPKSGETVSFTMKPPEDMQMLIRHLREDAAPLYAYDDAWDDFDDMNDFETDETDE